MRSTGDSAVGARPERFKLCAEPRCPEVVPRGQTYCEAHGSTGWDRWRRTPKGMSHAAGYGSAWRRARDAALVRAGHRCERCGSEGPLDVHHIDGRSPLEPGANALGNLAALCLRCHRLAEHEREQQP